MNNEQMYNLVDEFLELLNVDNSLSVNIFLTENYRDIEIIKFLTKQKLIEFVLSSTNEPLVEISILGKEAVASGGIRPFLNSKTLLEIKKERLLKHIYEAVITSTEEISNTEPISPKKMIPKEGFISAYIKKSITENLFVSAIVAGCILIILPKIELIHPISSIISIIKSDNLTQNFLIIILLLIVGGFFNRMSKSNK
jgi:hypothetical protein